MKKTTFILTLLFFTLSASAQNKEITPEDIFLNPKFTGEYLYGTQWIPGQDAYSWVEKNKETGVSDIMKYDCKTGEKSLLIPGSDLKNGDKVFPFSYYEWTKNGKDILLSGILYARDIKTGGELALYNLESKTLRVIPSNGSELKIAQLSPDGKTLGYVKNNNLFTFELASGKETQLTFDGTDQIINGNFDWVYEEEFSIINGWKWSPDSKKIAFWRLDQTNVPQFKISIYDEKYLSFNEYKYPKAGDPNSLVKIGVIDLPNSSTSWVDLGAETDIYVPRIDWLTDSNVLSVQRLNRLQNKLDLLFADTETGATKLVLSETSDTWVEIQDNVFFLPDGKSFIWQSEKDGFNHLYLFSVDGKQIRQLTKGNWDVDKVLGFDKKSGVIYFSAAKEGPMNSDLYRVDVKNGRLTRLSQETGTHTISMNPDFTFYLDRYSTVSIPTKTRLHTVDGKLFRTILENRIESLKEYTVPVPEFTTIPGADGTPLSAYIMKPVDFDSTKKYPVLFYIYGGPGTQVVLNNWDFRYYAWHSMLTQKGYIIVAVDNRGTPNRGKAFKSVIYKNLGKAESDDQIAAAKWLGAKPWVNQSRIGIWGWSYGGFLSAYSLFKGNDTFKAAIAVAPVTNWKFYDSIYTERYMQTPQLNPDGYKNAPIDLAKNLKGNFLLIHGTADDNVHFQNSVELVRELQKQGKQFETMYYPDGYHGIGGSKIRYHLFVYMTNWLLKNL